MSKGSTTAELLTNQLQVILRKTPEMLKDYRKSNQSGADLPPIHKHFPHILTFSQEQPSLHLLAAKRWKVMPCGRFVRLLFRFHRQP